MPREVMRARWSRGSRLRVVGRNVHRILVNKQRRPQFSAPIVGEFLGARLHREFAATARCGGIDDLQVAKFV
jgi:hypothetical protein